MLWVSISSTEAMPMDQWTSGWLQRKWLSSVAVLGEEELGVVEMAMLEAVGQNRRRRENGTGPAATPYFVDASDDGHAFGAESALEFPAERIAAFAGRHLAKFLTELTEFSKSTEFLRKVWI